MEELRCSIIVPTRDQLGFLRTCVEGVLQSHDLDGIELLVVDNQSTEPDTLAYLDQLRERPQCRVLQWPEPFNYSAINNAAVEASRGEFVCLLNNDIEITDPDWLSRLLDVAANPAVGAVGCVLAYPDGHIQHAGIDLDERSVARHIAVGQPLSVLDDLSLDRPVAVAAVTAACLVLRRDRFLRLHGLNERNLAVAFNDVDLCLRLADKGYPVLLHAGVRLIHHESVSRQCDTLPDNRPRAEQEHRFMQFRWRHRLLDERATTSLADLAQRAGQMTDLQQAIDQAQEALYVEKQYQKLPGENTGPAPTSPSRHSAHGPDWQGRYRTLELEFKSLEDHCHRLEEAHRLIENSAFWKVSAPIRRLRDALRRKPGPEDSPTRPASVRVEAPPQEVPSPHTEPAVADQDSKSTWDAQASRELTEFLASGGSLDFRTDAAPDLSILLVLFNRAPLTLLCLRSILASRGPALQLIIVDNHSTDETGELLQRIEGATILRNEDNRGFVLAVNQGAAKASTDYLLLLNNDAVLQADTLANALTTMRTDTSIAALGAKIKLLDGSLQEAGSIIWNDGACLGYGRGQQPEDPEYQFQRDVDYCSGAFLLIRNELFRELDGFDEDYAPAYYEESDFCIRLHKRGLRVVYDPTVEISHYEFASTGGMKNAQVLQARHREILCRKHADFLRHKLANDPSNSLLARIANNRPRVLLIDDRVPYPSLGAGYPRCTHLLRELHALGLIVTFYPLLFPEDDWQEVYELLPREIEVMLGRGQAGLGDFLRERRGLYDTVIVSRVHNMQALAALLQNEPELLGDARLIYDAEAVSAPREVRRLRLLGETISTEQAQAMIDEELRLANGARHIIAVSKAEAELYRAQGHDNTSVLGHVVATPMTRSGFAERRGLLFVGALRDEGSPNVDSLLWFLMNVWPKICSSVPDLRLTIVGDNLAPSLAAVDDSAIEFTGRLEDIEQAYDSHRVFIAPTRFAAGIPHKIHAAAGNGIPVVATRLLADQLAWRAEEELLVGDSATEFADACVRLHSDPALWQRLRDNAGAAVRRDCSATRFRNSLAALFPELTDVSSAVSPATSRSPSRSESPGEAIEKAL